MSLNFYFLVSLVILPLSTLMLFVNSESTVNRNISKISSDDNATYCEKYNTNCNSCIGHNCTFISAQNGSKAVCLNHTTNPLSIFTTDFCAYKGTCPSANRTTPTEKSTTSSAPNPTKTPRQTTVTPANTTTPGSSSDPTTESIFPLPATTQPGTHLDVESFSGGMALVVIIMCTSYCGLRYFKKRQHARNVSHLGYACFANDGTDPQVNFGNINGRHNGDLQDGNV